MRRRISIRGCVRPSVRPSVRRSVRPSVCPVLFSKVKTTHSRRILCRVSGLVKRPTHFSPVLIFLVVEKWAFPGHCPHHYISLAPLIVSHRLFRSLPFLRTEVCPRTRKKESCRSKWKAMQRWVLNLDFRILGRDVAAAHWWGHLMIDEGHRNLIIEGWAIVSWRHMFI